MATKKTEVITIKPIEKVTAEITIIGDSNLIVHAWNEKAKRKMLDAQQGKKSGRVKRSTKSCLKSRCQS